MCVCVLCALCSAIHFGPSMCSLSILLRHRQQPQQILLWAKRVARTRMTAPSKLHFRLRVSLKSSIGSHQAQSHHLLSFSQKKIYIYINNATRNWVHVYNNVDVEHRTSNTYIEMCRCRIGCWCGVLYVRCGCAETGEINIQKLVRTLNDRRAHTPPEEFCRTHVSNRCKICDIPVHH